MKTHRQLILIGLIAATVLLTMLIIIDPFLLLVLRIGFLVWIALPLGIVFSILLITAICKRSPWRISAMILGGILTFALLVELAIPFNRIVYERAVVAAKAYPEKIAPLLEKYRCDHGTYPANLDQVPSAPHLPWLLRRFGYHSDGNKYWFTFPQPGGLIDVWDYNSQTKKWHLST